VELGWLLYFSAVPTTWPGSFVKDLRKVGAEV